MPAQRGRDLLLKVDDGAAGLVTIGGLRTRQIAFNTQTVDVTHADSIGRWRELLAGAGVRRASISGAGIFRDEASDLRLRAIFFAGEIRDWQIVIPDFGTVSGPFQIASLEYRGEHDGEVTFDLALESAGNLIFTTAP